MHARPLCARPRSERAVNKKDINLFWNKFKKHDTECVERARNGRVQRLATILSSDASALAVRCPLRAHVFTAWWELCLDARLVKARAEQEAAAARAEQQRMQLSAWALTQ